MARVRAAASRPVTAAPARTTRAVRSDGHAAHGGPAALFARMTTHTITKGFDLPAVMGIVVFATVCVIVFNLVVDLLYAVIDPRIRLS